MKGGGVFGGDGEEGSLREEVKDKDNNGGIRGRDNKGEVLGGRK